MDTPGNTPNDTLARLEATIAQRLGASPEESYVAKLHARGLPVIARKLGEEAVETVIAALSGSREELTGEAADVLFHLLVLLAEKGVPLADVLADQMRHETGGGAGGEAARFEQNNLAIVSPRRVEQRQRDTRRLAGAGRRHEHGTRAAIERGEQSGQCGVDGERQH